MAGRSSKPVQLVKSEGKSHRTKKELDHREKMEQSLYTGIKFKESPAVKSDPIAHKEFLRLKKLYKHIEFVDGLDQQIINRYCLLISQEQQAQEAYEESTKLIDQADDFEQQLEANKQVQKWMTKLMQIREQLLKLEDRMFLTPAGRIKSIPKQPSDDGNKKKSGMSDFLQRRAGGSNASR